jgi:hypothetical protein
MTQADVERRFVEYNVTGKGGDRLTSGNWMFRKDVLFYQKAPYKRFVKDRLGLPLMIRKMASSEASIHTRPSQSLSKDRIAYQSWSLPTIGVWSRYEGDQLELAELHERMQFMFFAELRCYNEETVKSMSGADLAKTKAAVMRDVNNMYTRHHNYSVTFGLKWPYMPEMYSTEIEDAIDAKIRRYHDPKQAAARERFHARKVAKQAFGL